MRPTRLVTLAILTLLAVPSGCRVTPGRPAAERDALRDVVQLTRQGTFDDATAAVLSPDGRYLAFRGTPASGAGPQIYLAPVRYDEAGHVAGLGNPVRVTPPGSRNDAPAFGPDGESLLFASTAQTDLDDDLALRRGYDALAEVYRVDGWRRNVAAADARRGLDLARHPITDGRGYDGDPAVSPDGGRVAFVSDRAAPASALETANLTDVYLARRDGRDPVRLTRAQGADVHPRWLPGGRAILFESGRGENGRRAVYRLDLEETPDGGLRPGTPVRLIAGGDPAPHPDGGVIAYAARDADGNLDLRQVRPDGTRDLRLTFDPADDESPSFDASGRLLIFSSRRTPDGSRQVFAARYVRPRRS